MKTGEILMLNTMKKELANMSRIADRAKAAVDESVEITSEIFAIHKEVDLKALQNFILRHYWLWVALAIFTVLVAYPLRLIYQIVRKCGKAVVSAWDDTRYEMQPHWSRSSFEMVKRRYHR
jgi:hypothetical protein